MPAEAGLERVGTTLGSAASSPSASGDKQSRSASAGGQSQAGGERWCTPAGASSAAGSSDKSSEKKQ